MTMTAPEVRFRRSSSWWGTTSLESTASSPLPERCVLYIAPHTDDPPYPRAVRTGERAFDAAHFLYCDIPALLPFFLGETTRKLLVRAVENEEPFTLEQRDGEVRLRGGGPEARHVAVHRALADDHLAALASWQTRLQVANGHAEAAWPLEGTLITRVGTLQVSAAWPVPVNDRDDWRAHEDAMFTHLRGEHEGRAPWSIRSGEASEPSARMLGRRPFVISGTPSVALEHLPPLIDAAGVVALTGGKRLSVTFRGLPSTERIAAAVRIFELCHGASSSPYR
ncbi:MAG: hypothetical protein SFX73_40580 [Kofleriaceae bacterium]|nr:hypothetical protein [Kofleriaceae bacterium]